MPGEQSRSLQFDLPAGGSQILRLIDGYKDFNPSVECLDMLRLGFGLKDAPRAWDLKLKSELEAFGAKPTKADGRVYVMHVERRSGLELVLMLSTHVDDLKGCGERDVVLALWAHLERSFGTLMESFDNFENCGVMHEQDPRTFEVAIHQNHYARQLRPIPLDFVKGHPDDEPASTWVAGQYGSLVGAEAWMLLTRADAAVYIGHLQRHLTKVTLGHARGAHRVLKWLQKT